MPRSRTISCENCGYMQLKRDTECDRCGRMTKRAKTRMTLNAVYFAVMVVIVAVGYFQIKAQIPGIAG